MGEISRPGRASHHQILFKVKDFLSLNTDARISQPFPGLVSFDEGLRRIMPYFLGDLLAKPRCSPSSPIRHLHR